MKNLIESGIVRPLSSGVYLVPAPNKGRFPFCHGFLIAGRETVLIDAGVGKRTIEAIDRERRIDTLIVSHPHPDHIFACPLLADRRLLLPRETGEEVEDLEALGLRFTGSPEEGRHWAAGIRLFGISPLGKPDGRFGDGEALDFGGVELEAIRAPGHLEDHYCFFERSGGTLITTDIDFTSFGPWYANVEGDIEKFEESVRKIMALPYERACSSHKMPVEGEAAAAEFEAYLAAFDRQRRQVLDLLDRPRNVEELIDASPFFRNRLPDKRLQRVFEGNMIRKNLDLLVRDGLVEKAGGRYARVFQDARRCAHPS